MSETVSNGYSRQAQIQAPSHQSGQIQHFNNYRTFLHKGGHIYASIGYRLPGLGKFWSFVRLLWFGAEICESSGRLPVRFVLCRAAAAACKSLASFVPPWEGHNENKAKLRGSFPTVRHQQHLIYTHISIDAIPWNLGSRKESYNVFNYNWQIYAYTSSKFSSSQRTVEILPPTKKSDVV